MAKLPNLKRLLREDVKEAPNWIGKILDPLNSLAESFYQALNKQITFQDNISSQIYSSNFKTTSNYVSDQEFIKLSFTSSLNTRAIGVLILQITEGSGNYIPIKESVSLDWNEKEGMIYINHVTGLKDNTNYNLRLLII